MRTREEIEEYREELALAIEQRVEMFGRFSERKNFERSKNLVEQVIKRRTVIETLDWVLGRGVNKEKSVTIPKEEFEYLANKITFLKCLRNAGVENWEGYHTAQEMYEEEV